MRRFVLPEIVARAQADAPVARVWPLLGDLARHAEWNPLVARMEGVAGPAVGGERVHAVPPEPLGRLPLSHRVAVDVALVSAPEELGLVVYPLPGLTARLRVRLLPLPKQRTDIELRVRLAGLLAPAHWLAASVAGRVLVRSLATAAVREPEPDPRRLHPSG